MSIGFLMSSIFDTKCMWGLEKNTFKRHFADFVWMLLLGMMGAFVGTFCVPSYVFVGISLKFMILYYWTRRNPFFRVSLYMIPLKATLLPYALLFVQFLTTAEYAWEQILMRRVPWSGIIGIIIGHTYYFFRDVVPTAYQKQGKRDPRWTRAPRVLYGLIPLLMHRRVICGEEPWSHPHSD